MIKRLVDIIAALVLLLILWPVLLLVAAVVRVKMGSPVFFRQQRPGYREKPFFLLKFRTMTDGRDKDGNLLPDEDRLTSPGKFIRRTSLDELPQILNVLKGDMSFVGPRPLLMEYLPLYDDWQRRRHEVRPGITGWAQVNGRNAVTWEQRFAMDVCYVDNQSLLLDIRILWLTIKKVLRGEGVSAEGHVTMTKFKGNVENHET